MVFEKHKGCSFWSYLLIEKECLEMLKQNMLSQLAGEVGAGSSLVSLLS